jgi:riboflavin kinase/FMN adenylyltransferase
MRVLQRLDAFAGVGSGCVLSIGNFDGVHRGHQRIIGVARARATPMRLPAVALTFEPHPLAILAPERAPPRLTTGPEKCAWLARCGADVVIELPATDSLLATPAEEFVAAVVRHCRPRALVEGPDFNFGRGRGGSLDTLRALAPRYGFEVLAEAPVAAGELPGAPIVSSSAIRACLRAGDVARAAVLLGRPYRLTGRVVHGDARGAKLGFPTANLDDVPQMSPAHGVYAAVAQLEDGGLCPAAVNVGPQPTFGQDRARIEAHLLDFRGELRGARLGLHLVLRLRYQRQFAGADDLAAQLAADVAMTRAAEEVRSACDAINRDCIPLAPRSAAP